jgi:hypothetical protein
VLWPLFDLVVMGFRIFLSIIQLLLRSIRFTLTLKVSFCSYLICLRSS